jgi:hypothetical protein
MRSGLIPNRRTSKLSASSTRMCSASKPIPVGRRSLACPVSGSMSARAAKSTLIGGEQPSPLAKGPGQDPTIPHVALAVADIQETKAELDRLKVPYWSMTGINGPAAEQLFINDPSGNMVELHQVDQCRCRITNRI